MHWREALSKVRDLSAFADERRTLIVPGRTPEAVDIAQMTASGFGVARTAPLLGRPLLDADQRAGARAVLVIAYDEWLRRFDGDSAVIGRGVRLGGEVHTVIGVMPDGFHFPVNHRYWTALRLPTSVEPGRGPSLFVFGRLADGAALGEARAEFALVGARMAAAHPATHSQLRPSVLPYAWGVTGHDDDDTIILTVAQTFISLLLVVVAVNVAVLVYARTASRVGEIAIRTALGASRTRIVTQLFSEAFVLSGIAAVLGLSLAALGLRKAEESLEGSQPYWVRFELSAPLIAYVILLSVVAAVVVGVLPALQGTRRQVHAGLQQLASRGSQLQLGRVWTALIIAQIAVAVAVLPFAVDISTRLLASGMSEVRYPIEAFLRASVAVDREDMNLITDTAAYERAREQRFQSGAAELLRRLETEPVVAGITFATHFGAGASFATIEVDDPGRPATADTARADAGEKWVWTNRVAPNFFTVLNVPLLAGRGFVDADVREGSTAVVVDRAFVERFLGDGNPLGRRVRYIQRPDDSRADIDHGPWLEIVGVVSNFMTGGDDFLPPGMYRAATLEQLSVPLSLAIRVRGSSPATFAARLREITAAIDPTLRLEGVQSAIDVEHQRQRSMRRLALGFITVMASVLLLSAAGVYAMMSFTVVRRRREIGIRSALGADPRRILGSIFGRASAQLAAGVAVGLLFALALESALGGEGMIRERGVVLFPVVAGVIAAVGLMGAIGPARQGLAIQPTEALREE